MISICNIPLYLYQPILNLTYRYVCSCTHIYGLCVYVCVHTHIHTHTCNHTHKNITHVPSQVYLQGGIKFKEVRSTTYTHFNPYNAPYRALPTDPISLLCLGSSTHGCHGCLLVPSSGKSHFLPHKSPCADSIIAPTHHFTGCFHHPKKQQC